MTTAPNLSGPASLTVRRGEPVLFTNTWLVRPTNYPRYRETRDGFDVTFSTITSDNLRVEMARPELRAVDMTGLARRGDWADHFHTVLYDAGRYRMWYEYISGRARGDLNSCVCYAESDDAMQWHVRSMRRAAGVKAGPTHAVYPTPGLASHGATVFKDPSDARHPYKMIYYGRGADGTDQVEGAVSEDGLRWHALEHPLVPRYKSDTQTVAAYDAARGVYVGYFRYTYLGRRGIGYAETDDFTRWPRPRPLIVSPSNQHDIYTSAYTTYPFGGPNRFLFPALYRHNADNFELAAYAAFDPQIWQRLEPEAFVCPQQFGGDGDTIITAGVGLTPLDSGRSVGLPLGHADCLHNQAKKGRRLPNGTYHWAVWPRDRIAALRCTGEGRFATVPLDLPAGSLRLNFRTGATGRVRVALLDAQWNVIPGYTADDCRLLNGDRTDATVAWGRRTRLPRGEVRAIQFDLRNAALFSLAVT